MAKKSRRAIIRESPGEADKTPRFHEAHDTKKPVWAFCIVDTRGPWCWKVLGVEELAGILSKLQNLESMTWTEISQGHHNHFITVKKLCKKAQDRLVEIGQDDATQVYSLCLSSLQRIIGIRVDNVMRLLWWDPLHEVCPSKMRRT